MLKLKRQVPLSQVVDVMFKPKKDFKYQPAVTHDPNEEKDPVEKGKKPHHRLAFVQQRKKGRHHQKNLSFRSHYESMRSVSPMRSHLEEYCRSCKLHAKEIEGKSSHCGHEREKKEHDSGEYRGLEVLGPRCGLSAP
jgi:hypothetical protein